MAWTEVDCGCQRPGVRASLTQAVSLPSQKPGGGWAGSRVGGVALVQAPAQCRGWYSSRPDVTGPCWTQTLGAAVLQAWLEGRHTGATGGGGGPAGVSPPDSVSPSSWLERWWGPGAPRLPFAEFWWLCHPRVAKGPLPFASLMGAGMCGGGGALDPREPSAWPTVGG